MDFAEKVRVSNERNSFIRHNGITLVEMREDYARVEAHLTRESRNLFKAVHGGMFFTMADSAAGSAARTNGMRYVTVSSSFEFYRNTDGDFLVAEGRIKHRGRTICVAEAEVRDGEGKLLCGGTFTLYCTGTLDGDPPD